MKINTLSVKIGNYVFSMEDCSNRHSPWHLEGGGHNLSTFDLKEVQKILEALPEVEKKIKELLKEVD